MPIKVKIVSWKLKTSNKWINKTFIEDLRKSLFIVYTFKEWLWLISFYSVQNDDYDMNQVTYSLEDKLH